MGSEDLDIEIERMKLRDYERLDGMIKGSMRRSASEVVQLGFLLRQMMDGALYSVYYSCFDAYLEEELHIDYTAASRFIGINKKYSVGGKSEAIDEKYAEYSQGLLIEMLSMPSELEKQITPDMTVRQAREIKREARQKNIKHNPDVRGPLDYAYCSACGASLDEDTQPARCPECGQLQDWDWYNRVYQQDAVVEDEYREVGHTNTERDSKVDVATSQPEECGDYCRIEDKGHAEECPYYAMGLCDKGIYERCPVEVEEEFKRSYRSAQKGNGQNLPDIEQRPGKMTDQEAIDILSNYKVDCCEPGAFKVVAAISVAVSCLEERRRRDGQA